MQMRTPSLSTLPLPAAPLTWGQGSAGAASPSVDLVLKDVEVVGGGYGDDVLVRVPRCVKDLLAEV